MVLLVEDARSLDTSSDRRLRQSQRPALPSLQTNASPARVTTIPLEGRPATAEAGLAIIGPEKIVPKGRRLQADPSPNQGAHRPHTANTPTRKEGRGKSSSTSASAERRRPLGARALAVERMVGNAASAVRALQAATSMPACPNYAASTAAQPGRRPSGGAGVDTFGGSWCKDWLAGDDTGPSQREQSWAPAEEARQPLRDDTFVTSIPPEFHWVEPGPTFTGDEVDTAEWHDVFVWTGQCWQRKHFPTRKGGDRRMEAKMLLGLLEQLRLDGVSEEAAQGEGELDVPKARQQEVRHRESNSAPHLLDHMTLFCE